MKRYFAIFCVVLLSCAFLCALAEGTELAVTAPSEVIRPGRAAIITITAPTDGICSVWLFWDGKPDSYGGIQSPVLERNGQGSACAGRRVETHR